MRARAGETDGDACAHKGRCFPVRYCPAQPQRKVIGSIDEPFRDGARDVAQTIARATQYAISCKLRMTVEMCFADLKRILGPGRLR